MTNTRVFQIMLRDRKDYIRRIINDKTNKYLYVKSVLLSFRFTEN